MPRSGSAHAWHRDEIAAHAPRIHPRRTGRSGAHRTGHSPPRGLAAGGSTQLIGLSGLLQLRSLGGRRVLAWRGMRALNLMGAAAPSIQAYHLRERGIATESHPSRMASQHTIDLASTATDLSVSENGGAPHCHYPPRVSDKDAVAEKPDSRDHDRRVELSKLHRPHSRLKMIVKWSNSFGGKATQLVA